MSEFEFGEVRLLIEGLSTELQRLEARVDAGFKEINERFDRQDARLRLTGESACPTSAGQKPGGSPEGLPHRQPLRGGSFARN